MMKTAELRQAFLDYFADKGHEIVPSSPLVPGNDPTLLFTNAGMVQFKEVFTGEDKRHYNRAVTVQRCVRAGGKHNDLDNVGYTARHHTFFEMLGNFSFGDYFKHEAIEYAWNFLTKELKIPQEKLWITVFEDDEEAADIWLKDIGVSAERFSRCGEKDNFWAMGNTGPCGPCTEIFYDHGTEIAGGPPGTPDEDGDRYIEIWNLVFTQFDRSEDGTLTPLPKPSVDTGMGLERIAAVMQDVHVNYEIDLFQHIIKAISGMTDKKDLDRMHLQVVADHIRSCAFIIADGVVPSNEGRGYVLRRIIRRAVRHGHHLGFTEPFFYRLVDVLDQEMGDAYPELRRSRANVEKVLKREEQRFAETLEQGLKVFEEIVAGMSGTVIPGEQVFKLYDTYGFPIDLTADIARERQLSLDTNGFDSAMAQQRSRARAASQFDMKQVGGELPEVPVDRLDSILSFSGYQTTTETDTISALYNNGEEVEVLHAGDSGVVILACTPFYAESGGQVGDTGLLKGANGQFDVLNTQKQGKAHCHIGTLKEGELRKGEEVRAEVNSERRQQIVLNHSATHLMHAALRQVLGEHVQQKGSLVDPDRLRFDFSHADAVSADEIRQIEDLVNQQIRANHEITTQVMPMQQAIEAGAMALFGEKYEEDVRVLGMGVFSIELCGGTHAGRTGDIGIFKLISEAGVAAGVRRIEALTGAHALSRIVQDEALLDQAANMLKASRDTLQEKLEQVLARNKLLEKDLQSLKSKMSSQSGSDLADSAKTIGNAKILAAVLEDADVKTLRETVDQLKNKLGESAIVLGSIEENKVRLVAGVTPGLTDRIKAGDLVNHVATQVGGKGGGRPDMAQAGGSQPENLPAALDSVYDWATAKIE